MKSSFDISVQDIKKNPKKYVLVDVREAYELTGPEGSLANIILAPMSSALTHFLESADPSAHYVFICRSGIRSAQACKLARDQGLTAYNMEGGMIAWRAMEA